MAAKVQLLQKKREVSSRSFLVSSFAFFSNRICWLSLSNIRLFFPVLLLICALDP